MIRGELLGNIKFMWTSQHHQEAEKATGEWRQVCEAIITRHLGEMQKDGGRTTVLSKTRRSSAVMLTTRRRAFTRAGRLFGWQKNMADMVMNDKPVVLIREPPA